MVHRPQVDPQLCFVLMPFKQPFFGYYERILKPAAEKAGLRAVQAGEIYGTRSVIRDIWDLIWKARVVVADVTGKNPNVNYELGMCHALGIPTVLISKREEDIPFDYRHRRYILYNTDLAGWEDELREKLTGTLTAAQSESTQDELPWPYDTRAASARRSPILTPSPTDIVAPGRTPDFLIRGADVTRGLIAMSFGPHGRAVSIWNAQDHERVARRGHEIAGSIQVKEPYLRAGHHYMQRVADTMFNKVGDGSKIAVLIAHELLRGAYECVESGLAAGRIKREIRIAVEQAVTILKKLASPASPEQVSGILSTAHYRSDLAAIARQAAVSGEGAADFAIFESRHESSRVEQVPGVAISAGYLSPYFRTEPGRESVELEDCLVLVVDGRIQKAPTLVPCLEHVAKAGRPLLIVAQDAEEQALAMLVVNKVQGVLKVVAVGTRRGNARSTKEFELVAEETGTSVMHLDSVRRNDVEGRRQASTPSERTAASSSDEQSGKTLETMTLSDFGQARYVVSTKSRTVVCGNSAAQPGTSSSAGDRLTVIHLRSDDHTTFADDKATLDAAIRLARSSLHTGCLPGGGAALAAVARQLRRSTSGGSTDSVTAGARIVAAALEQPLHELIKNSGADPAPVFAQLELNDVPHSGYDIRQERVADMAAAAVFDSAEVLIAALEIAHDEISQLLNIGAWHVELEPTKKDE